MNEDWYSSFQEKLDQHYAWPSLYIFKFIVPKGKEIELKELFPLHTPKERESKKGNYTSVTLEMMMPSSEAVIHVYKKIATVEGIIAL
jgi:putative lipoic acid-binding regulatory protein